MPYRDQVAANEFMQRTYNETLVEREKRSALWKGVVESSCLVEKKKKKKKEKKGRVEKLSMDNKNSSIRLERVHTGSFDAVRIFFCLILEFRIYVKRCHARGMNCANDDTCFVCTNKDTCEFWKSENRLEILSLFDACRIEIIYCL